MLLNLIQSLALALATGVLATTLSAVCATAVVASANNMRTIAVIRYAAQQPISTWPTSLTLAMLVTVSVGLFVTALFFWMTRNTQWSTGSKDVGSVQAANELVQKSATDQPQIFAGRYGGRQFTASIEDRGLVIGPPGTGKTAFLLNQILQATNEGLSFAAVDIKPELHSILHSSLMEKGYRVIRLNPAVDDPSADHWNPLDDIQDETELVELCSALLPIREPRDAPFLESQRDWLKAAVFHVGASPGGSLPMAFDLLSGSGDPAGLLKILADSPSPSAQRLARRLQAGMSGQKPDPLIVSGLTGALRTLDFLSLPGVRAAIGHSDFSIRELGKSENPTALFLQFEEAKLQALGPVLAFAATGLMQGLIQTANDRKPVAIFLDELGNMPPIPGLAEKLNTIRSRSMPTWMYFQTIEQINRRYGNQADAVFMAASDVQIFFRLNDQPTRELVSKLVGTTIRQKHSVSAGDGRGRTVTTSRERVAVIEPHELGQLRPGEVLTLYRGAAARGIATPYFSDFPAFKRK